MRPFPDHSKHQLVPFNLYKHNTFQCDFKESQTIATKKLVYPLLITIIVPPAETKILYKFSRR